jgi:hypothetical protein
MILPLRFFTLLGSDSSLNTEIFPFTSNDCYNEVITTNYEEFVLKLAFKAAVDVIVKVL